MQNTEMSMSEISKALLVDDLNKNMIIPVFLSVQLI